MDFGVDFRYNTNRGHFLLFEYNYSKIKGGESFDDDVTNGLGFISYHGVDGRTNDYKVNFAYKISQLITKSHFFITMGAFYKDAQVTSTDGRGIGVEDNTIVYYSGYGNQTNSIYQGIMFGIAFEYIGKRHKFFLQADRLIPLIYHGEQIWYGRTPDLYWQLDNNEDGDSSGIRLKAEYALKLGDGFFKYLKLYSIYEQIDFRGITETEPTFRIVGGDQDSLILGEASYQSFSAGIAIEF